MKITTLSNVLSTAFGQPGTYITRENLVPYIPTATLLELNKNFSELANAGGQVKRAEYDLPEAVDTAENFLMAIVLREDLGVPVRKGFSAYYVVAKPHTLMIGTKTYLTEEHVAEDFEGLDYAEAVEATKLICACHTAAFWDHVKSSSKLSVLSTCNQYGHDSLRYGIDPDNLGYEIVIKGGSMLSFHTGWFGTGWLNELTAQMHLPDRVKDNNSNHHLQGVLDGVRAVIKAAVPYENLANDDIDIYDVRDYINKTLLIHQQYLLTVDTTSPFKNSWLFYVDGKNYEPVEITVKPILRDSLHGLL